MVNPKVKRIDVEGYDAFCKTISEYENKKIDIYVLFSGSVDSRGKNWCSDCEEAEPVVNDVVQALKEESIFIHVAVGPLLEWKDPNNPFRKDSKLKLKSVPTLIHWGKSQRLEENECKNIELLKMVFEDE